MFFLTKLPLRHLSSWFLVHYYVLPQHLLSRLQSVQNTAARTVTRTRKFEHITPILKKLHWLPVHYRIVYKILLLVYKALNGAAPRHISDLIITPLNGH